MPYSTANRIRIYYEVSGEGLPFVMIHANPFDHNLWMYQIAHFSTYFKVIAVDIRGYGRSDKSTTPFSLKEMGRRRFGSLRRRSGERGDSRRRKRRLGDGAFARVGSSRDVQSFDPCRRQ